MGAPRLERQRQQRRLFLERAVDLALSEGLEALQPDRLEASRGLQRAVTAPEALLFADHAERLEAFLAMLENLGLAEACLAWARFQEEDRDFALRRLALVRRESRLAARRALLDEELRAGLAEHFRRFGAGGVAGERAAEIEAALALAALREAERQWAAGEGRPRLPVLVQEALGLLWPALYAHARRHLD